MIGKLLGHNFTLLAVAVLGFGLGFGPIFINPTGGIVPTAMAQEETGNYLYRVTTLRAAPGKLLDLMAVLTARRAEAKGEFAPVIMRHSQGDQWDLLLMYPMSSYREYYAEGPKGDAGEVRQEIDALSVFREELFAYGPPPEIVVAAYNNYSFFHIEMFAALAGKKDELLHQRIIENQFLASTGQTTNLIFVGDLGSNIDIFTIGFYPSIVEFAAPSTASTEEAEAAAIEAGFEGRAYIGTYLRELLAYHHDTLATKVE